MSNYGFGQKREGKGEALDLSRVPTGPVDVDPGRERDALARGERLGFVSREVDGGNITRTRGRPRKMDAKSITVRGPREVIDSFISFTNAEGYASYWEALDDLLKGRNGEG